MRHSIGLAWIAGFLITSAAPLAAQTPLQKAGGIVNTPARAPVEPPRVETVRRTTVIIPEREVVVIERVQARHRWWLHPRYRVITMYYDGQRFYRRPFGRRPFRKVVVYERAGRYYLDEAQWRRDHRRYYGRDYDGWKDDDQRRHDERWRDDDRWKDEDKDRSRGNNGRHRGQGQDKDND